MAVLLCSCTTQSPPRLVLPEISNKVIIPHKLNMCQRGQYIQLQQIKQWALRELSSQNSPYHPNDLNSLLDKVEKRIKELESF